MYSNRNYIIFNVNEINKVDFNQILETSTNTLRKSVDGTKTFVKWDSKALTQLIGPPADDPASADPTFQTVNVEPITPIFVQDLTTAEGPYTHEEMLQILSSDEWTDRSLMGI